MKKADREHIEKVLQLPCSVCGNWPVNAHHTGTGMGRRKTHLKAIPLCFDHHQGKHGFHTMGSKAWEAEFGTEEYHVFKTMRIL